MASPAGTPRSGKGQGKRQQGRLDYNQDGLMPQLLNQPGEDLATPGMRIIVYGADHEYRKCLHPSPNRNFDDIGSFIFVVLQVLHGNHELAKPVVCKLQ